MMALEDRHVEVSSRMMPTGRRTQIATLLALLGIDGEIPCEAVFLYGHSGTGKSLVVSWILKHLYFQHSWVNCLEAYSPRILYELILRGFQVDGFDNHRCANYYSFYTTLQELVKTKLDPSKIICIVLENADRLFTSDMDVIPSLLRLQEFTKLNISIIVLSEITWGKFLFDNALSDPVVIYFPEYTSEELMEIIRVHRPMDCSPEFYDEYIRLLLKTFCPVTRSTREILHMAKVNFTEYKRPVDVGEAKENDTVKLWQNIKPHLQNALSRMYLRSIPSDYKDMNSGSSFSRATSKSFSTDDKALCELPFYSKFLLIASYLASYNPPKTDCKFFVKQRGKQRRKSSTPFRGQKHNRHMEGPKPFTLDRLLAIFFAIVEDRVTPSGVLISQISTLVSLRMLALMTTKDIMTNPKYKCLVNLECVQDVARTVNFDPTNYLEDFI